MISYYDLLGLIKENNIPKEVKLYLCNKSEVYYYSEDDNCYLLKHKENENDIFYLYMRECITDVEALDKIIKIVENC